MRIKKKWVKIAIGFVIALVLAGVRQISRAPAQTSGGDMYVVEKVVDGDTVQVRIGGKKETIRLIGVDTPETVDPRKPVQCFGHEAAKETKRLVEGKTVKLEADPSQGERDKYQRLLRHVFLADGTNVNEALIANGFGHEYTYDLPYKYQAEFKAAEELAREQGKGLWAPGVCGTMGP